MTTVTGATGVPMLPKEHQSAVSITAAFSDLKCKVKVQYNKRQTNLLFSTKSDADYLARCIL